MGEHFELNLIECLIVISRGREKKSQFFSDPSWHRKIIENRIFRRSVSGLEARPLVATIDLLKKRSTFRSSPEVRFLFLTRRRGREEPTIAERKIYI